MILSRAARAAAVRMMEKNMKTKLMAAVAVLAIVSAAGVAKAQTADELKALKAQSAALKKQNAELEKRLAKIEKQQAKTQAQFASQPAAGPAPTSFMADLPSLKGPAGCAMPTLDGPLTFCGITVFGTFDTGVSYATHGAPNSGGFYAGDILMQKFYNGSQWSMAPSGLSQTTVGIKGEEELMPGLAGVFYASTGINPQSGQLANAPGSQIANNGIPLGSQSMNIDGTRGGQAFNDQLYVGVSNQTFGELTFGRHKSFSNDLLAVYDPAGGAYDYSPIGYSGTPVAGLGETDLGRQDETLKYLVNFPLGQVAGHFGAMYKFAEGNAGLGTAPTTILNNSCGGTVKAPVPCKLNNDGYQFDVGAKYAGFELDGVISHYNQALTYGTFGYGSTYTVPVSGLVLPTLGAQGLSGTVADITSFMIAGKYTWNQFKFYAGYANDRYSDPSNPQGFGANTGQGDYPIYAVNNAAFIAGNKIYQTEWVGVKYAFNSQTDFTVAYYHESQNNFTTSAQNLTCSLPRSTALTPITGASPRSGNCAGDENIVSAYVDYHFTKRFDAYGGFMYSAYNGGLAAGSIYTDNFAPTAGVRYTF
jgi:predicted porin